MEKGITRLYINDMTQEKMYKIFDLHKVSKIKELEDWLSDLPDLNTTESLLTDFFKRDVKRDIDTWQKQDLLMKFVGPIINSIDYTQRYQLRLFSKRPLTSTMDTYQVEGEADFFLSNDAHIPTTPYYAFCTVKPEIGERNDPAGQNLAAMLVGQQQNQDNEVIYGSYIVGRNWYFMVLKGKEFAISKSYAADDEEIFEIIKVLKALRNILYKRLGVKHKTTANEA